jgi:hypothetical protein
MYSSGFVVGFTLLFLVFPVGIYDRLFTSVFAYSFSNSCPCIIIYLLYVSHHPVRVCVEWNAVILDRATFLAGLAGFFWFA